MGYSALLAGAGLFSGVVVQQRTSDPGAFKTMLLDQFKLAGRRGRSDEDGRA